MKKLTIILMVLSVFMTMTQCKKDLQVHSGIADDAIFIHVDVNDGSKVNVNTTTCRWFGGFHHEGDIVTCT